MTDYLVSFYFRDRTQVRIAPTGRAQTGPWWASCPHCETEVLLNAINKPIDCLCGMHAIEVSDRRPEPTRNYKAQSVEVFYRIMRGRGVRANSLDPIHESEIASTVADLLWWKEVLVAWTELQWNPYNLSLMLRYYREGKYPGTKGGKDGKDRGGSEKVSEEQLTGGVLDAV
jgi:hypothetical protein